jgi:DNA-binding FadR family transcriptional regulator
VTQTPEPGGIPIVGTIGRDRPDKIAEVVARDLIHDLVSRNCRPGDSLDSEQAMLAHYGVSRESLREALRLLEVQGLITIRRGPGGGAFVGTVNPSNLGRTASLYYHLAGATYRELFEAWALGEAMLARLAASNPEAMLRRRLMERYLTDPHVQAFDQMVERHPGFHASVGALAGNRVLEISLRAHGLLLADHYLALIDQPRDTSALHVEQDHGAIAAAIVAGDAAQAEQLMAAHVRHVNDIFETDGLRADDKVTWV